MTSHIYTFLPPASDASFIEDMGNVKLAGGCLCTLIHTKCPKDKNQQTLTHLWNGRPGLSSIRRLWVLWHAAMTPYPDSAILSHLPLTTRSKVFPMLTNGEAALCPQTEEGRSLFIRPEDGIMELRRDLTTPSLPFMMAQAGSSEQRLQVLGRDYGGTSAPSYCVARVTTASITRRWLLMTCDSCRSLGDSDEGGMLGLAETKHAVFAHFWTWQQEVNIWSDMVTSWKANMNFWRLNQVLKPVRAAHVQRWR